MKFNKQAYAILNKDEKSALTLHNVHNKSTWQAGEIMKKSHYKYLEIKQRAQRYFEMFTVHFNIYGEIVPPNISDLLSEQFKEYLHHTIIRRLTPKGALQEIRDILLFTKANKDAMIGEGLDRLMSSQLVECQNLYSLIMEFDRYNNFRILPEHYQEPSAFKRRNKTRYRRHLEISVTIQPYTLYRLKDLFTAHPRANPNNIGYICLINPENGINEVVKVNTIDKNYQVLTGCSLYIFKVPTEAKQYSELVSEYIASDVKSPKQGLEFWPRFRNLVKRSINYYDLNNITPTRKYLMSSLRDMDIMIDKKTKANREKAHYQNLER